MLVEVKWEESSILNSVLDAKKKLGIEFLKDMEKQVREEGKVEKD